MPDKLIDQVAKITSAVKGFLGRYEVMSAELNRLDAENRELKAVKDRLESEIRQLEEQIFILKSSIEPLNEHDKKDFEKRINEYLRTVRKCIAILQN